MSEEVHRQPRAENKYWVGDLPSGDHAATCSSSSSSFMAGMDQKGRCSGMYEAGIVGHCAARAVFFPGLAGPECRDFSQYFLRAPGIWQSLVQCLFSTCLARGLLENSMSPGDYLLRLLFYGSGMCKAGFPGYDALRAVFLSVRRPMILWHHGGMDRKDSCWYCWFSCTSRSVPWFTGP